MPSALWTQSERALATARALERAFNEGPDSPIFPSAQDIVHAIRHADEFRGALDAVHSMPEQVPALTRTMAGNSYWAQLRNEEARKSRDAHNEALLSAYLAHREIERIVWRVAEEFARLSNLEPKEAA